MIQFVLVCFVEWRIVDCEELKNCDNESSRVYTLPGFSICEPVPVIRGPTRFLTMAEVAEVEDGVVIIDCVAIVYEEGEGGEHYRNKNKFRCRVSRIEKRLVKLNE